MIIAGRERLYDIGCLAYDQAIGELFDISASPKDTTLRDNLLLVGQKDLARAA